jgi:hypothetical protein
LRRVAGRCGAGRLVAASCEGVEPAPSQPSQCLAPNAPRAARRPLAAAAVGVRVARRACGARTRLPRSQP